LVIVLSSSLTIRVGSVDETVSVIVDAISAFLSTLLWATAATIFLAASASRTSAGDGGEGVSVVLVKIGKAQEHIVHARLVPRSLSMVQPQAVA
jgi:hypothetical protein